MEKEKVWESKIGKMQMKTGEDTVEDIPVFLWSYKVGFIYGGDVYAYPHLGILLFQTKRGDYPDPGYTGDDEKVLKQLESFGWGKPPHIKSVYEDVSEAARIAKTDINEFLKYCKDLETKWKSYIA